jgi:hypothetical protein
MGDEMTLADIYIFSVTECLESGEFDHVDPSYLNDYPILKTHLKAVWASTWFVEYDAAGYDPKLGTYPRA